MDRFADIRNPAVDLKVQDCVHIGSGVVLGSRCQLVEIGYGCFVGNDIYIDVDELIIGDYTTIHHGSVLHGIKTQIGHNCWFGHYTIIDSLGGDTRIGNNVGVGAHSQLWSHMKFGDTLNGCRWNSSGALLLDDDVWLVGQCIVGPIHAKPRAMLMTGGVATKDLEENNIYAGAPAVNVSEKLGTQFAEIPLEERIKRFKKLRREFCETRSVAENNFEIVESFSNRPGVTQFNVKERTYCPARTHIEHDFIKYMLYDKAKWIPVAHDPLQ